MSYQAPIIIPYTPDNAIGLTVVLPFTDYGSFYEAMTVLLSHEGAPDSTPLNALVEFSYEGFKPNKRLEIPIDLSWGEEGSIDIDIPSVNGCKFIRVSVTSNGDSIPFKWSLLGRKR